MKLEAVSGNILAIASTPYHLMVLLFIRENLSSGPGAGVFDVVITDKTPSLIDIFDSGRLKECFDHIFFADSKLIKNPYKGSITQLYESFIKNPEYDRLFSAPGNAGKPDLKIYSHIFFASPGMPDEVSKEIIKSAIKANRHIRFHRYEDGFASYTKAPVCSVTSKAGRLMYKTLMGFDIKSAERDLFMFEPSLAESNVSDRDATGFELCSIKKDDTIIGNVTNKISRIFAFNPGKINARFLFLGQGTDNVTGNPETYASLIRHIADTVGYDDFCIKPHPRGVYDRFDPNIPLYEDPAPFELMFTGSQMEDKTLISYYSTACISGKLLFDSKCRIIFLYPLAGDSFNEKCAYEDYFEKLQKLYDNIFIARSKEELDKLLTMS